MTEQRILYKKRHAKLHRLRGSAKFFGSCVDCGDPETEWSQLHETSGDDVYNDYVPRCVGCHELYDNPEIVRRRKAPRLEYQYKLSWDSIDEIRRLAYSGKTHKAIATRFGISRSHVTNIVRGATRRSKQIQQAKTTLRTLRKLDDS